MACVRGVTAWKGAREKCKRREGAGKKEQNVTQRKTWRELAEATVGPASERAAAPINARDDRGEVCVREREGEKEGEREGGREEWGGTQQEKKHKQADANLANT